VATSFAARLIAWQHRHGRHDLPWQGADAYRVWLSEIMLQQTQVATVIPYYQRFVATFPDIVTLANASEEQVLEHWSGLGYYARGRNLHKAARLIVAKHHGEFPNAFEQVIELPGVGRSTAAAICALAFHQHRAILDGNVKRVLARYCGITGWTGDKKIEAQLWQQAELLLPPPARGGDESIAIYIQAQMDMGATLCTRSKPKCNACPVQTDCVAYQTNQVAQLPTPRPRKAVPERHATFLLLMHGNDILLERRPAQGIWGGLWCLPQLDDGGELVEEYVQRNGMSMSERAELAAFTHTFTHFKLHITPVLLYVAHKPMRVQEGGSVWLEVEDALQAAIPTPVRMMLEQVRCAFL
jgi:A/G-specific adenine glycosylase